ncbi:MULTISPECIES: hypothetical protein [Bradyrhizobium]|uniref:hypothetical protein n=1 Tax=Bradyrhizobium TaxID=374 RepID=UPI0039C8946E
MAAVPLLAGIVQQPLLDVLEDRVRAVEATASTFWISTIRPQREHDTLRICWGISASRVRRGRPGRLGVGTRFIMDLDATRRIKAAAALRDKTAS